MVRRHSSNEHSRLDFDVGYYSGGYQMRVAVLSLTGENGYVGIGNSQPGERLDVAGNVRASGAYYVGATRIADATGLYFGTRKIADASGVYFAD